MSIDWNRVLVLDLEGTDGTYGQPTEILQLSLLDGNGARLLNEYYRPRRAKRWPYSQKVHHITRQMVLDKPYFSERRDEVQKIIHSAQCVVGFGMGQDLHVLMQYGIKVPSNIPCFDVYGGFLSYCNAMKLQNQEHSLAACAEYFKYIPTGEWHDSLEDCRATLFCFKRLLAVAEGAGKDWTSNLRLRRMPRDPLDKTAPRRRRHRGRRRTGGRGKSGRAAGSAPEAAEALGIGRSAAASDCEVKENVRTACENNSPMQGA